MGEIIMCIMKSRFNATLITILLHQCSFVQVGGGQPTARKRQQCYHQHLGNAPAGIEYQGLAAAGAP